MKRSLLTCALAFGIASAYAGAPPASDLQEINRQIGIQEIESAISNPDSEGLPGAFLGSLLIEPTVINSPCPTAEKKTPPDKPTKADDEKKSHIEVVVVSEVSTAPQNTVQTLPPQYQIISAGYLVPAFKQAAQYQPTSTTSLNFDEITNYAVHAQNLNQYQSFYFNDGTQVADAVLKKNYVVEALVQTIPQLKGLSDDQVSQQIASFISKAATTDEAKFNLLAQISDRLYDNYNNARNPGGDSIALNPKHVPLPPGNMSQSDLFTAAANQNILAGGVCNDIAQSIAGIGAHLFPNKDVLTITSGTHFGVIVSDGKQTRVIDGGDQFIATQQSLLTPGEGVTTARISKVINGQLKEIAVIDTQLGQVMNTAFGSDRPLLKTGASVNDLFATSKLVFDKDDQKKKELSITGGSAVISDSAVTVIVAKFETFSAKNHSYVGAGLDSQNFGTHQQVSAHLRAGYDYTLFRYVSPRVQMDFKTGIQMDAMTPLPLNTNGIAGALETVNKFHIESRNSKPAAVQFSGTAQVRNSLGPRSWGATTGETSSLSFDGTIKALGNMNFHLNEIVVNGTAIKPLNATAGLRGDVFYQGSNIGQSASIIAGIQNRYPSGTQFYIWTGIETSGMGGYQTQHSLLVGPSGGKIGIQYQGKNGSSIGAAVQGIGSDDGVQINATAKFTIKKKAKKPLPAEVVDP